MDDLHKLGWYSFQQLCLTIVREILGQTVQSFLGSKDGVRDGAFEGTWSQRDGENLVGKFVVQCKFTGKPGKTLQPSDLTDEIEKARRLVIAGRCACYLLMTNAGVSGKCDEEISVRFKAAGVKQFRIFASEWIWQQIRENKRLRMLVPRVYGIGDLSQILDERAYGQALKVLASMREDLSKVVLTKAYGKAARALDKHRFVLLLGEPACGKTTIAAMLTMAALDNWGASPMKLEEPSHVVGHWSPDEPSQFFWIDDAFGVTQYEPTLVFGWNRILAKVASMLVSGARILLTSRDYIYHRARHDLKDGSFPLLEESQVVIDVQSLTPVEKRQILYNHIKLGAQVLSFRQKIKPHLEDVAAHNRFVPEVARRLGSPMFTKDLNLTKEGLSEFIEHQREFLLGVIRNLDVDNQASLSLVFMRNGSLESPIQLRESEKLAIERFGSNLGSATRALGSLKGSLIRFELDEGKGFWKFKHPTIGDAFGIHLLRNPELLGIFVQGAPVEKLVEQITCGDVGLDQAVIVYPSLYPIVIERLAELQSYSGERSRDRFLAYRCDSSFLDLYFKKYPELLDRMSRPDPLVGNSSEAAVIEKLFGFGLLPERNREMFIDTVTHLLVVGADPYLLKSEIARRMLSEPELQSIRARIRGELIPTIDNIRDKWESNFSDEEDPSDYIEPFVLTLGMIEVEFSRDAAIRAELAGQLELVRDWIENCREHGDGGPSYDGDHEPDYTYSARREPDRSIFDDIDQ